MSTVLFKRGSTSDMNDTNIQDGLLFFNTETYKIYMDNGTERIQYGGDTDLISSAEDASLTNAFNAETSLGLFSQKATVVDSKANALSVTQNYIPLGCLAFKEALGTTNYSTVGNGTISGALVSLNTSVSNLNTSVSNLSNSVNSINGSINELNNRTHVRGTSFYFDNQGGVWGFNTSSARGAGTFVPFSRIRQIYLPNFYVQGTSENANHAAVCYINLSQVNRLRVDQWYTNSFQYGRGEAYIEISPDNGANWARIWHGNPPSAANVSGGTWDVSSSNLARLYVSGFGAGTISGFEGIWGYNA